MTDAERDPAEAGHAPDLIFARQRAIAAQVAALEAEAEQLTRLAGFRDDLAKQGIPFEVIGGRAGEVQLVLTVGGDARVAVAGSGATVPRGNLDAPKWTEAEENLCWDMAQEGYSASEIGPAYYFAQLRGLKRRRGAAEGAADAAPEPEPEAPPKADRNTASAEPRVAPQAAPPFGANLPEVRQDLRMQAHLNRVRDVNWPAARDLALAEGICSGRSLPDLAPEFDLGFEDLKARWHKLLPEPTLDGQQKLLRALRQRASDEDAA